MVIGPRGLLSPNHFRMMFLLFFVTLSGERRGYSSREWENKPFCQVAGAKSTVSRCQQPGCFSAVENLFPRKCFPLISTVVEAARPTSFSGLGHVLCQSLYFFPYESFLLFCDCKSYHMSTGDDCLIFDSSSQQ